MRLWDYWILLARKTDRSSKLPFLNVFDHAVFHHLHSLSRFVLLVFQPYRIARYSWILTVKSLKFLGVWRGQSFDSVLPFARAWKEFWSTTLRFSQEPQRTFRLVYEEFQSWRIRDHSRSSRWNSRGNKQDDRGLFNWKEGRWNLRIKAVLGFKKKGPLAPSQSIRFQNKLFIKVARTSLYACWLYMCVFFRMKDSTDFYDFWHTK